MSEQTAILFIVATPFWGWQDQPAARAHVPTDDRLVMSVSHTTLAMRPEEQDGRTTVCRRGRFLELVDDGGVPSNTRRYSAIPQ